jgi:hypothetical protein
VKTENAGEIVIPELEEIASDYRPRNTPWTEREMEILRRYYKRVPSADLLRFLPGRTMASIYNATKRL